MSYIYTTDNGDPISKTNPLPVFINGGGGGGVVIEDVSLLPANTTTAITGTSKLVTTNKSIRIEVWGTGTYTVEVQGIGDSGTPRSLPVWNISGLGFLPENTIVAAGFYDVDVEGFKSVQCKVKTITGGNVNASGRWLS